MKILNAFILLSLYVALCACNQPMNPQETSNQKQEESISNQLDLALVLFNQKKYDDFGNLAQKHIQEHPEDTKWVNRCLGIYYEQQKDYTMAEKYYTLATWFDYSKVDGLLGLQRIIYYKSIPIESAYKSLLEYWEKISVEVPFIVSVKARVYIIKNESPERFPYMKEYIFPGPGVDMAPGAPFDVFPKDENWSVFKKPNDLIIMAKESFEKADYNTAMVYYKNTAYGYILDFDPIRYSRPWEPKMWENPPYDPTDEEGIDSYYTDWSPVCFNKIAECYIKKAESEKPLKTVIENYKIAIYYYHRACWGYQNLYELNLPRIKQLRQKIKELESQLNQTNPPESSPK